MTDTEFLDAFTDATLPRREWTHAAHLRMAYLYLRDNERESILPTIRAGIRRYNEANGNFTGYNECVTVAFVRIVAGRLSKIRSETFDDFVHDNADLFEEGAKILLRYYGYPVWKDPISQERFIEPEVLPLP